MSEVMLWKWLVLQLQSLGRRGGAAKSPTLRHAAGASLKSNIGQHSLTHSPPIFHMPMEAFKAGEALLRSSQPLLPFLAPGTYRQASRATATPIARHCRATRVNTARSFSTTPCRHQQQNNSPPGSPSTTPSSQSAASHGILSLLDTLDLNKGTPTAPASQTSRFPSPNVQQQNTPFESIAQELQQAQGKELSSLKNIFNSISRQTTRHGRGPVSYGGNDITSMLNPNGFDGPPAPISSEEKPVDLPKNVGRMQEVNDAKNIDVGRAFRMMESTCVRNRVRKDFLDQRYHERPGMKRKRLKRQRWAKRFKDNFIRTVQLVQRMKKQGW
ncbi:hypothetical protein AC578_10220 [Pseudocercospora eumusae]|uniref:Uncharacterized protein n=1 Tax=Pseudocercospora eumusae TaxID=321146 RepID=A0A139HYV9_9PEZI|nr:hypothetical protein AC578_10220 [Pseudocercospora eumusae]